MVIEVLSLVFSIVALIIGCFAGAFAAKAWISVEAMRRSTHSVQLVPVDQLKDVKVDDDKTRRKLAEQAPTNVEDPLDLGDDAF